MATMVKEKKREKKKAKEKIQSKPVVEVSEPFISITNKHERVEDDVENAIENIESFVENVNISEIPTQAGCSADNQVANNLPNVCEESVLPSEILEISQAIPTSRVEVKESISYKHSETNISKPIKDEHPGRTYEDLNLKMERMRIPVQEIPLNVEEELSLEALDAYIKDSNKALEAQEVDEMRVTEESVIPSAPVFEDVSQQEPIQQDNVTIKEKIPKPQSMSLEKAVWLFGGEEMEEIRKMSEKEESIVEVGPLSGPDHPLVDLLSTLRSSLIFLEREKNQLLKSLNEEEQCRMALWKIEKKTVYVTDLCPCGASVQFRGKYDHAEFMMEKLPAARMRLTALLRDVQEGYCHHQHSALLAFYQIEDFLYHVVRTNKKEIREALSLIMQALRRSDTAPSVLANLLERWATILSSELVDARDPRQLLFLLHHLFKQSRSVRWAARAFKLHVGDRASAARAVAVLGALLARPALESALECGEDTLEAWEELGAGGRGGAVGDGALRERDLLALLRPLPLRQLLAHVLLFSHADVSQAREQDWRDPTGGAGVLRASCGARALLAVLQLARTKHANYHRLHAVLRRIAGSLLRGLAGLHLQNEASYTAEMRARIPAELEASYAAGLALFETRDLHRVPASLLTEDTAREFCMELIFQLHESSPQQLSSVAARLPALSCAARVSLVSEVAVLRTREHELARFVLEFLMQTGLKKKSTACKGGCEPAARARLPAVLAAHPYLYTIALHLIADMNQAESLEPSCVSHLCVDKWQPTSAELLVVLEDWSQRCASLLQQLLMRLEVTQCGLSLQCQLTLATWLRDWSRTQPTCDWKWAVLRRLRLHRAAWSLPLDAPDPEPEPEHTDLFGTAVALLASSWGHSVPIICSHGAAALCRLANSRPLDAAHCLSSVLLAMAASPDSISLASKFTEFFNIMVNAGPSLVQRALGWGGVTGAQLLQKVMLAHLGDETDPADYQLNRRMMLTTWLHALWRAVTLPACATLVDTAILFTRDYDTAANYAARLIQEMTKEQAAQWVKLASTAPQAVECVLLAMLACEQNGVLADRLLDMLHLQRVNNVRVNVDTALQQMGSGMKSDELVIYRASAAALAAPAQHPAQLALWRVVLTLYLQRPRGSSPESTPPVGPLFFSGIIKSRTLSSIKKRLQETIAYHHNEALSFKALQDVETKVDSSPEHINRPKDTKSSNEFLGVLSITDFIDESCESSDSDDSEEDESKEVIVADTSRDEDRDTFHMYCYHVAAEKMIREYVRWLDEGDKVRALPYHAEIARFIPEQALNAARRRVVRSRRCEVACAPALPRRSAPPPPPAHTVFQTVLRDILMITDRSTQRKRNVNLSSALGDVNVSDAGMLLSHVDKQLQLIVKYAGEWRNEVSRITTLDEQLLSLVRELRVPRDLSPQLVRCANKCKPRTLVPKAREWCISTGADEGIKENRRASLASLRRLTKPSLPVVRAAVALQALARSIASAATARRVLERAGRAARACGAGLRARALLAACQHIADHWISHDGALCAELLTRWSADADRGGDSLQQALCGTILDPRKLGTSDFPTVYTALLRCQLPSHVTFSYLSRFEVSQWAAQAPAEARNMVLSELSTAVCRWGAEPDPQHHVLIELIGVHTSALLTHSEICSYIARCTQASIHCRLPPQHWTRVLASITSHAHSVPLHELGHLLRELGTAWWEARTRGPPAPALFALYAPLVGAALAALQRAFVAAAVAQSYAPERVCTYAWSGAREAWSPWVQPAPAPPLAPAGTDDILDQFRDTLLQTMQDCPGIEEYLLGEVWEWGSALGRAGARGDVTRLLRALRQLPFQRDWLRPGHVQTALQISRAPDVDTREWCACALRGFSATRALAASEAELAPQLAALLYLFTAPFVPFAQQTLSEACSLPWHRLPEPALDEALERFFMEHYNLALSYHDVPQFKVLLSASELVPYDDGTGAMRARVCAAAREKRVRAASAWQRAASAPKLIAHAASHAAAILNIITNIAPCLDDSPLEVEELLSRAIVIMCIEPAGTAVLPVWQQWVSSAPARLRAACVSAAAALTSLEPFAALADAAARALLAAPECGGWSEISRRWAGCPWSEPGALCARARLHAAYACARARPPAPHALRTALLALLAADINFVENSAIVSTWICFACRTARSCSVAVETASDDAARECGAAARALLTRWAAPRRGLLTLLMQQPSDAPTALHRVLSSLALCILSPNDESVVRGFESACGAVHAALAGDAAAWGRSPRAAMLPTLAVRFHPTQEAYFKDEIELVSQL